MKRCCLFACAALFLALAPIASAQAGVTLINQATAARGLPGCAPQSGFLITICHPGSYELSGSLEAGSDSGLYVSSNDVAVNLNGYAIRGSGAYGIELAFSPGANGPAEGGDVFTHGAVEGFNTGIGGNGQAPLVARGMRVAGFEYGISYPGPADVESSRVTAWVQWGIAIANGTVRDCRVISGMGSGSNVAVGVYVETGPANVRGNTVTALGYGLILGGATEASGNTVSSQGTGIDAESGSAVFGRNDIQAPAPSSGPGVSLGDNACNGAKC